MWLLVMGGVSGFIGIASLFGTQTDKANSPYMPVWGPWILIGIALVCFLSYYWLDRRR